MLGQTHQEAEDRPTQTIQTQTQREKKKKNEKISKASINSGIIARFNIREFGIPEKDEKEMRAERYMKNKQNFPNVIKISILITT